MRAAGAVLAALIAVTIAGCGPIQNLVQPNAAVVQVEIWNRTVDDIFLVDNVGAVINVPACGHVDPTPVSVARVEIRMDAGLLHQFDSRSVPGPQFLVIVAAMDQSFPSDKQPVVLPPCIGHPRAAQ